MRWVRFRNRCRKSIYPAASSLGFMAHRKSHAMHELSIRKIRALIVLEQEIGLDDYVRSGTSLNAQLSTSLLLSLLYPGNPLHDGAVIIRGTSVVAAACVLPLSADHAPFKLKGMGMRLMWIKQHCNFA